MGFLSSKYVLSCSVLLALLAGACEKDRLDPVPADGFATNVKVGIVLPQMELSSRADITANTANTINNIWVGVFDYETGEATYNRFFDNLRTLDAHIPHLLTLDRVKAGKSRIVAVANYDYTYAVSARDNKRAPVPLGTLLEEVATWDDYRAIAVLRPSSGSVETPQGNITMSGSFYEGGPEDHPAQAWEEWESDPSVFIPASVSGNTVLEGYIHLRRDITQVRFELRKGGDVIELEPYYWRVYNIPELSWVHERGAVNTGRPYDDRNAGDRIANERVHADPNGNYAPSNEFGNEYFTIDGSDDDKTYVFDFWQYENKRIGVLTGDERTYANRDRYIKNDDGTNGAFFASLHNPDAPFNDKATYVEIRARIRYKQPVTMGSAIEGDAIEATRTADVHYLVHLGYIEGDGPEKVNDFVCRRNSRYTYRVTVKDVNNVLVEATEDNENQPAAWGYVSDVTNEQIQLDAHYHAFNIRLSNFERTNGARSDAKMSFAIEAYDADNELLRLTHENYESFEPKYWKWVELRPTTGEQELATYKPHDGTGSDGRTFYLTEAHDLTTYPNNDGNTDPSDTSEQWYTVFVNEYVYENSSDESAGNWHGYVGKNPRSLWIIVAYDQSVDKGSVYYRSKYAIRQRSIQTYFNTASDQAIGIEHVNESLGLNLRWEGATGTTQYGRYNIWQHVQMYAKWGIDSWSPTFVFEHEPFERPFIERQGGVEAYKGYLPALYYYPDYDYNAYDPIPDNVPERRYITLMNACMNRNRDNNGNGRIDLDEVRWYVPSTFQYIEMVLGRAALETPILSNPTGTELFYKGSEKNKNTRYHFGTSDGNIYWSEEGFSVSAFGADPTWNHGAWQVRCIRDLGRDLTKTLSQNDDYPRAYTYDKTKRTIYMDHYASPVVRTQYRANNWSPHHIYDRLRNQVYYQFEYAEEDLPIGDGWSILLNDTWTGYLRNYTNFCKDLNDKRPAGDNSYWRLPNQKELTIMWRENILTEGRYYISSTHEYFGDSGTGNDSDHGIPLRYIGINGYWPFAINYGNENDRKSFYYSRCVRDVRE